MTEDNPTTPKDTPKPSQEPKKPSKKPKIVLSEEEKQLKSLEKQMWQHKRMLFRNIINLEQEEHLEQELHKNIAPLVEKYSTMIQRYFETHTTSLFAYDIEERHNKLLCFCGIEIFPSMDYKIFLKVSRNVFQKSSSEAVLQAKIRNLFTNITADTVIAHGNNPKERELATKTNKVLKNSELYLQLAMNARNSEYCVNGIGLSAFEEKIGHSRIACKFFKHDWHWKSYFRAMDWSYQNILFEKPPRICIDCQKPQDVLLYCLEDAFTSLLIYMWAQNNKSEITSEDFPE